MLIAVKKQLAAEVKKREAAQQAAATAAATAEAQCEQRVSEMREQLSRAHLSMDMLARNAAAAEKVVAEAEARAAAAEEAMADALSQGMRAPSPTPQAHTDVPTAAERIVAWQPFSEPSSVC